eukprot:3936691-Rhodomonas_salina.2
MGGGVREEREGGREGEEGRREKRGHVSSQCKRRREAREGEEAGGRQAKEKEKGVTCDSGKIRGKSDN